LPFRQVGADIRTENIQVGLAHARANQEVHDRTKLSGLLSVPRYADTLEAEEEDNNVHYKTKSDQLSWNIKAMFKKQAEMAEVSRLILLVERRSLFVGAMGLGTFRRRDTISLCCASLHTDTIQTSMFVKARLRIARTG
jgi:hypothetical protein